MLALIKSSICRNEIPLKSIKGKKFGVFVDTFIVAIACSFRCDVNPYLFSYFLIVATASVVAVAIVFAFAGVVVSDVLECLEYHRVLRFFLFCNYYDHHSSQQARPSLRCLDLQSNYVITILSFILDVS